MAQRTLFDKATLNRLKKYPLYSQDGKGDDAVVSAKIFNPYGGHKIFITEYDGDDTMYGFASMSGRYDDPNNEYGYFSKKELENTRVRVGGVSLPLERDISYRKPKTMGEVMERELHRPKASRVSSNFNSVVGGTNTAAAAKGQVAG